MTSYKRQKPLWGSEEAETACGWDIRKSCIHGRNSIWNGLRGRAGVLLREEGKPEREQGGHLQRQRSSRVCGDQEGPLPQRCLNVEREGLGCRTAGFVPTASPRPTPAVAEAASSLHCASVPCTDDNRVTQGAALTTSSAPAPGTRKPPPDADTTERGYVCVTNWPCWLLVDSII